MRHFRPQCELFVSNRRPLKSIWWRTAANLLLLLCFWGVVALFSIRAAFAVSTLWLMVAWLRDRRYQNALSAWIANAERDPLPPARGPWDDTFAELYRQKRESQKEQAALADALTSLRRAAQALPDGVVLLNAQNQIIWCNAQAEEHLDLKLASDAGQGIANLLRAPDFQAYLAQGEWDSALLLRVRTGSARLERALSVQLIEYGDSQRLLLSRDVTKLERLETMRRDFVANVSHELKTPLTVLSGFLETIREIKPPAKQRDEYLALMSEQAARMATLVSDLLTLSELEGSRPVSEDRIDMHALLKRIEDVTRPLSGGRHDLSFSSTPGLNLEGAESEIASALTNLVTNAIRYTPPGGRIEVSFQADGDHADAGASFVVTDTGIGIPTQHLPRLTERFYRVDRGRSRDTGGTGLGLAIVKHVLTRHQAQLEITSTVGIGSRFMARFPAARVRHDAPAPRRAAAVEDDQQASGVADSV